MTHTIDNDHEVGGLSATAANSRMHQRSGAIQSDDPLATLLYLLARNALPLGQLEDLVRSAESANMPATFTNGWLAEWAIDAATRVRTRDAANRIRPAAPPQPKPEPKQPTPADVADRILASAASLARTPEVREMTEPAPTEPAPTEPCTLPLDIEPDWRGVNPLECTIDGVGFAVIGGLLYMRGPNQWLPVNRNSQLNKEDLIIFGRIADELEVLPWQ